jgi:hypothetical protein
MPWYFLQILCYANHAAAAEAAEQHLPLLLEAIAALRIGIAAHPSDYDDVHRVCPPCGRCSTPHAREDPPVVSNFVALCVQPLMYRNRVSTPETLGLWHS